MAHAQWYTQETSGRFRQFFAVFSCFSLVARMCQSLGGYSFQIFSFGLFWQFSLFLARAIKRMPLSYFGALSC